MSYKANKGNSFEMFDISTVIFVFLYLQLNIENFWWCQILNPIFPLVTVKLL